MKIEEKIYRKFLYFYLNLDYPQNIDLEIQTNNLINYIMNDFVLKFEDKFKEKYVVYEYQDDIFSIIGYHILKHIQAIVPFQLLIYGKKFFKNYKFKEKYITKKKLAKLEQQDKVIFISSLNPIYKVVESKKVFRNFDIQYQIVRKLTIEEFKMISTFYNITIDKKSKELLSLKSVKQFSDFCNGIEGPIDNFAIPINVKTPKGIYVVNLTGDLETDNEKINEVIDKDYLIFYKTENVDIPILKTNFPYFLKNKANTPSEKYFNINEDSLIENLKLNGFVIWEV